MRMPGPAVLFVPASNGRALAKAPDSGASALIYDLEDAVAPAAKATAREALRSALEDRRPNIPFAIRINATDDAAFGEDLLAARAIMPDAIVVPKVEQGALRLVADALDEMDAPASLMLWAMIETPRGVLDLANICEETERLSTLVAGTNDLAVTAGLAADRARTNLHPWLMQIVLVARATGLACLDGVHNDFSDLDAVSLEADEGAAMGFDGKTLIHPAQIRAVLTAFQPTEAEMEHARRVVEAFSRVEETVGIVTIDGRMVERLHLAAALRVLNRIGDIP